MAVRLKGTYLFSSGSGVVTVPNPGVEDGDLIVLTFAVGDNTSNPTTPSGWTLKTGPIRTGVKSGWVYTKIASSEGASWAFGSVSSVTRCALSTYEGHDGLAGIDVASGSFTATGPNVTTGVTASKAGWYTSFLASMGGTQWGHPTEAPALRMNWSNGMVSDGRRVEAGATGGMSRAILSGADTGVWLDYVVHSADSKVDFPDIIASTESTANGVTSHPTVLPATIEAGKLILIFANWVSGSSGSITTGTAGGYTHIAYGSPFAAWDGRVFWKIADGTEGGTTFTWLSSVSGTGFTKVLVIGNASIDTPPEIATRMSGSTSIDLPSFSPSWGAEKALYFGWGWSSSGVGYALTNGLGVGAAWLRYFLLSTQGYLLMFMGEASPINPTVWTAGSSSVTGNIVGVLYAPSDSPFRGWGIPMGISA